MSTASNARAETRVITTDVPAPLYDRVGALADRLERSRGWIVEQALQKFVDLEERRYRMTLEGLADADAGRLVDHAQVQAWAESLDSDRPLPTPSCA